MTEMERVVEAVREAGIIIVDTEPVIRCKHCKHFTIVDETPDMEYPIRGCWLLTWRYGDDEPQDEDGYCAWGEAK